MRLVREPWAQLETITIPTATRREAPQEPIRCTGRRIAGHLPGRRPALPRLRHVGQKITEQNPNMLTTPWAQQPFGKPTELTSGWETVLFVKTPPGNRQRKPGAVLDDVPISRRPSSFPPPLDR